MFSQDDRCIYAKNPLAEVICQLRFPEILKIGTSIPADFQEAIRDIFPKYSMRKESPAPKLTGAPGHFSVENQPNTDNYQFSTADNTFRVNLTSTFISLACSSYRCWEEFAKWLDKPLASFIRIYKPAYFERVGLRYLNFVSRKALGVEKVPFSELITPCYLGVMADSDVAESSILRCSMDVDMAIRGGCRVKLHAGPGLIRVNGQPDQEVRFILDQDLYMAGNIPVNTSAGALQTLHAQAFPVFRGAITDLLHNAMDPEQL